MKNALFMLIMLSVFCCGQPEGEKQQIIIDLQGHRGARGLLPENSIPGFLKALDYPKVTTLELDLAVTRDHQLIVSHEPWFNPAICTGPKGERLSEEEKISVYQMSYEEIRRYDCGSLGNPRFPDQQKMKTYKPLLSEVIDEVNQKIKDQERESVSYNIEIKSGIELDSIFTPSPEEFSDLVVRFIREKMNEDLVTVQSFDFRVLRYINDKYPEIQLAALVENEMGEEENLRVLGFKPDIYSSYYKTLSQESIKTLHAKNIRVIPWTVNDTTAMKQLIGWEVDGIITDYPNLAQKLLE